MKITNYSKNIEKPEQIEISRVSENDNCVRLTVPIGQYRQVSVIVNKEDLKNAIENC